MGDFDDNVLLRDRVRWKRAYLESLEISPESAWGEAVGVVTAPSYVDPFTNKVRPGFVVVRWSPDVEGPEDQANLERVNAEV